MSAAQQDSLWPTTTAEAKAVQERLRGAVECRDRFGPLRRIAGVDAHVSRDKLWCWAAVAVLDASSLELLESVLLRTATRFPYVPGLLSFREAPAILEALALVSARPDLVMVDGQGVAHPRRIGIASHIGVIANLPVIGVAKSRLCGSHDEPGAQAGDRVPLTHEGEIIGAVLRNKPATRPLYVSTGHRVSLESAVTLVRRLTTRYRLPEPTRLADRLSRMHS